jgi:SanA protein
MKLKKIIHWILRVIFGLFCSIFLIQLRFLFSTSTQIMWAQEINDSYDIGIVLGASVYQDGTPSSVLQDRLDTAITLYKWWVLDRILVSGDNGQVEYNEVHVMSKYLLDHDIPASAIFQDYAWFDTYDSIYRAREIFMVEKMIIITQQFHLPRAVAIANDLWIQVQGARADRHNYPGIIKMQLREVWARVKAFGEIVFGSSAKFGGEEISIEGESNTIDFEN